MPTILSKKVDRAASAMNGRFEIRWGLCRKLTVGVTWVVKTNDFYHHQKEIPLLPFSFRHHSQMLSEVVVSENRTLHQRGA